MIPFDINLLYVKHAYVKSCTMALGGSITVVDEDNSTPENQVFKKVNIPFAVARLFIGKYKTRQYLKPVLCALTHYDGHVVAVERKRNFEEDNSDEVDGLFGIQRWLSDSERNIDKYIKPLLRQRTHWYTDGMFLYTMTPEDIAKAEPLTSDGRFRAVFVESVKLSHIHDGTLLSPSFRTALQYVTSTGESAITPPIWKSLFSVGHSQMAMRSIECTNGPGRMYHFDRLDVTFDVNVNFAMKAGRDLANLFGVDAIEPLQLDRLMVELNTVNIPSVDKYVKATTSIGLPFSHALAWLIGLTSRVNTLDKLMVLRSLLKYLTQKGVYRKRAFEEQHLYRAGYDQAAIPMMTADEALEAAGSVDRRRVRTIRTHGQEGIRTDAGFVGTLYGAE